MKSDADRLFEVIFAVIHDYLPDMRAEHKLTLAEMVTGILRSGNVQFHEIARKLRYKGKKTSLADKFRRFVRNKNLDVDVIFFPFLEMILASLKDKDLIFMIDTSKIGRNCICLMLSVYYKGRALPLCWSVYKGKKGHSSCQLQLSLLNYIMQYIDEDTNVIFLGDGEFDSTDLIKWLIKKPKWQYVCRTAKNIKVFYEQAWVSLSELPLVTGEDAFFTDVLFTKSAKIEHVNIAAFWNEDEECHWFMVTDMMSLEESQQWYRFRFTIETLFSDLKGRGFHIDKTRLHHPERVSRLILTTAIAYLFSIFLGTEAILSGAVAFLARAADSIVDTYYSLFQIGLMYLDHLLNECESFPRWLRIPSPDEFYHGSANGYPICNY